MAIASVLVANLFVGINARAWTWFIFGGVWLGTVVMFAFAPIYASFTSTYSYGNNHFLYPSIQFWMLGLLTCFLALLPRVLAKCFRQSYYRQTSIFCGTSTSKITITTLRRIGHPARAARVRGRAWAGQA